MKRVCLRSALILMVQMAFVRAAPVIVFLYVETKKMNATAIIAE